MNILLFVTLLVLLSHGASAASQRSSTSSKTAGRSLPQQSGSCYDKAIGKWVPQGTPLDCPLPSYGRLVCRQGYWEGHCYSAAASRNTASNTASSINTKTPRCSLLQQKGDCYNQDTGKWVPNGSKRHCLLFQIGQLTCRDGNWVKGCLDILLGRNTANNTASNINTKTPRRTLLHQKGDCYEEDSRQWIPNGQ